MFLTPALNSVPEVRHSWPHPSLGSGQKLWLSQLLKGPGGVTESREGSSILLADKKQRLILCLKMWVLNTQGALSLFTEAREGQAWLMKWSWGPLQSWWQLVPLYYKVINTWWGLTLSASTPAMSFPILRLELGGKKKISKWETVDGKHTWLKSRKKGKTCRQIVRVTSKGLTCRWTPNSST